MLISKTECPPVPRMPGPPGATLFLVLLAALAAGCSSEAPRPEPAAQAKPKFAPELEAVATSVLGAEAEVVLHGDLARTGTQQVLVVNRLPKTPPNVPPGLIVTRAALLEKDGQRWKEIFRADEHLKNAQGYLGGAPLAPVTGWRIQHEQSEEKGLSLYFTPIHQPAGGHIATIGVRWNPKVKRYQSLDRNFEKFQGEAPALDKTESILR